MLHLVLMAIAGSAMSISGSTVTWDFTLNPDGTGKVVVENLLPPMPVEAAADKGAEEILRMQFLRETMFMSGGVEVWSNVSMEKTESGRDAVQGHRVLQGCDEGGLRPQPRGPPHLDARGQRRHGAEGHRVCGR